MNFTPAALLAALNWRYATKKFDASRLISPEAWDAIEQSLVLTPSSFGIQPWKFIVVKNPEIRSQLVADSWGQLQVADASHYVVLAARTDLDAGDIDRWMDCLTTAQATTHEALAPYKGMMDGTVASMTPEARHGWNVRQVYIALGQLMAAAAVLGIDTCPMEGITHARYDEVLGLTGTGYATAVACALGYRAADDKYATIPKARFPRSEVVTYF